MTHAFQQGRSPDLRQCGAGDDAFVRRVDIDIQWRFVGTDQPLGEGEAQNQIAMSDGVAMSTA